MVAELEMTPCAYMDIPYGLGGFNRLRIVARTIAVLAHSRESALAAGYSIINRILAEVHRHDGIVWWRTPPHVDERAKPHPDAPQFDTGCLPTAEELEDFHPFKFRARIATSPDLPETFWEGLTKKEGERITLTANKVWEMIRDPLAGEDSELYSEEPDFDADLPGLRDRTYGPSMMYKLRSSTLRGGGKKDADIPTDCNDFGCAAMTTPGQEAAGHTMIAATIGNAKQISKTSSLYGGGKPRRRVRKAKRHPTVRRKGLQ